MRESDRNLKAPVYSGSLLTAWLIRVWFVGQAGGCGTYPYSKFARLSKTFFREKSILRSVCNFCSFCACREARFVEVWLHSFLTAAMDRGEWSGWRPLPRYVRRKKPTATVNSRLGGCPDFLITSSPKSPAISRYWERSFPFSIFFPHFWLLLDFSNCQWKRVVLNKHITL
jgi:hypothetical protein